VIGCSVPRRERTKIEPCNCSGWYGAKAGAEDLRTLAGALLSEQRPDGGWAQLPALSSDAYATGQALVALHSAGTRQRGRPCVSARRCVPAAHSAA
jgi:hypothetical protein